jgi:uncharacterized membrane protein YeaQ/YmgE (transglycosylase-associated protein family)
MISILVTGIAVGIIPGLLALDKIISMTNIALGITGALLGALLGFGDLPLFIEYPFLNEITLMVAVSFLFVFVKILIARTGKAP